MIDISCKLISMQFSTQIVSKLKIYEGKIWFSL